MDRPVVASKQGDRLLERANDCKPFPEPFQNQKLFTTGGAGHLWNVIASQSLRLAMTGRVHQISLSKGGVPKLPVAEARVLRSGVEGDRHHDRRHGGPEQAVCLFSLEVIQKLRKEGHPIEPGGTGENLTISGVDWAAFVPGMHLSIGDEVELEIASYTQPCSTIRKSFTELKSNRIKQELHPGESRVYARVLKEGMVRVGDPVRILDA
jgi:MOSC domain-containing protein YiiM